MSGWVDEGMADDDDGRREGQKVDGVGGWVGGWKNKQQNNVPSALDFCSHWKCAELTLF